MPPTHTRSVPFHHFHSTNWPAAPAAMFNAQMSCGHEHRLTWQRPSRLANRPFATQAQRHSRLLDLMLYISMSRLPRSALRNVLSPQVDPTSSVTPESAAEQSLPCARASPRLATDR